MGEQRLTTTNQQRLIPHAKQMLYTDPTVSSIYHIPPYRTSEGDDGREQCKVHEADRRHASAIEFILGNQKLIINVIILIPQARYFGNPWGRSQ